FPKRQVNRPTRSIGWWLDSRNEWEPFVATEPRGAPALLEHQYGPPVLRPDLLTGSDHRRPLPAVAHRLHARGIDAEGGEVAHHHAGPLFAERQVVFARAALVAMSLDHETALRLLLYLCRQCIQGSAGIRPQLGRIILEEDAVRCGGDVRAGLVIRQRPGLGPRRRSCCRLWLLTAGEQAGRADANDERTQRP